MLFVLTYVQLFQNNFPLIETLLECGAKGSVGKTSDGSQVLHVQAEKADDLDLSDLYPDAHVVSDSEISSKLHTKIIVKFLKATCKRTQQLPKLLGKQCWELLRSLQQWCAKGCNNSQQCWVLQCIVEWSRNGVYPCVMRMRGHNNNVGRGVKMDPILIQHRRSWNKRNIGTGSCWLKSLTGFKLCVTTPNNTQQHTTTFNIVCIRTQHVTSNNVGSCWPATFRPFARGLTFLSLKTYLYPVSFSCPKSARKPENAGHYGIYANNER